MPALDFLCFLIYTVNHSFLFANWINKHGQPMLPFTLLAKVIALYPRNCETVSGDSRVYHPEKVQTAYTVSFARGLFQRIHKQTEITRNSRVAGWVQIYRETAQRGTSRTRGIHVRQWGHLQRIMEAGKGERQRTLLLQKGRRVRRRFHERLPGRPRARKMERRILLSRGVPLR
jgi:hypothetical protein